MNTTLYIFLALLIVLCVLLMRRILKLEYAVFDLNDRLQLSDQDYIDLFDVNTKLTTELENFTKTRNAENSFIQEIKNIINDEN